MPDLPETMNAMAVDEFGGVDKLTLHELPVPEIRADELLVRVHTAGVGVWDPWERKGGFADRMEGEPSFPYVLGSDGAGVVAAVGADVTDFAVGDRVYGFGALEPRTAFYAEYAAVRADSAARLPAGLDLAQAGAMPADAITALVGLDRVLDLREGEKLLVYGASGGVGHLAVQLAKRMGAEVLAVASGEDGVALVRELGADAAVDGRGGDVAAAVRDFAPDGLDAVLATANGDSLTQALGGLRPGGRLAWPNGVEPAPRAPEGVSAESYDGEPDAGLFERLNALIEAGPFRVVVSRAFPLADAPAAHRALREHYLGKLALDID